MSNLLRIDVRDNLRTVAIELQANYGAALQAATVSALNRTATTVRAEASRRIRERYNLKAATVREQLRIGRASRDRLTSSVIASGRPIPLFAFSARQNKRGVSVRVTRERKTIPGVFIAKMKSGRIGVFERTSKKRLPIRELYSVSLPQAFTQRQILTSLRRTAGERFKIELARELRFRQARAGREF